MRDYLSEALAADEIKFEFSSITAVGHKGDQVCFEVFSDAAKIDGVRFMVTAIETQELADALGLMMTTPKIEDLIAIDADITIAPITQIKGNITALAKSEDYSAAIDKALDGKDTEGKLISTVGKSWVLTNKLAGTGGKYGIHTACNYGWVHPSSRYNAVTSGLKCWQSPGYAHNDVHKDASQVLRLVNPKCTVLRRDSGTWEMADLHDILSDSELASCVSHEGVLKVLRQPSVPEVS
jgi:hypothetical protein